MPNHASRIFAYSMTSSANNKNDSGMIRPSSFAVFSFTTRQLYRQISRICAAQDAINVTGRFAHGLQLVNPIGDQTTTRDIKTE